MNRLFLDSNVLFTAAHNPSGKAALVIELGAKGCWKVLTSTYAVEEAQRNSALKFPQCLPSLRDLLKVISVLPSRASSSCSLAHSEKDRVIFASALHGKATHLLTGDVKHFAAFMNNPELTSGITIQSVGELLADSMKVV